MGTEITNLGAGMYILFGDLIWGNLFFANLFLSTQNTIKMRLTFLISNRFCSHKT